MSQLVCNTVIKAWEKPDRSVDISTNVVTGITMMHNLTKEEWEVIELFLDALSNSPSPVPYILHEIGEYIEHE